MLSVGPPDAVCAQLGLTFVPEALEVADEPSLIGVADVDAAQAEVAVSVARSPIAAQVLMDLLRVTADFPVEEGLRCESLAYSMLMAGSEHRHWLSARTRRSIAETRDPVVIERNDDDVTITLNRPDRHNAFGRAVRDGLIEALEFVELDTSVVKVRLAGAGASFCSGGDLDEFGLTEDVSLAHLIRVDRSVGARLARVADRVEVELHGACIGAGIELAAFAGRVVARPDARIQLPELRMGLIPGAGGTVSITKRIGRWRTAWLALSGEPLPLDTALRWGLVDELVP